MKHKLALSRKRYVTGGLFALVLALGLLLIMPLVGQANTVYISDAAHVLNAGQVRTEAANLPDPINIYTTNTFNGSTSSFDQETRSHLTSANLLVMAIDTVHKHLAIVGGSNVPLSNSQYNDATQAFVSAYSSNNSSYTAATIASISSLRSALGGVSSSNSTNGGIFSGLLSTLLCVGLIILVIAGVFFVIRRRRSGFGRSAMPMGGNPMPYNQPYNRPYNQPYNQGYPPNYGGPYNQGQGINPLAAGGLGAAAGGLLGYELGKEQGEDQMRDQGQYQGGGGGNDFGGGSSADFGSNNGGDFGGGSGADFGSGGDGGGGGGDFGGGGGGGGSADF